jgi:hypothetical protein
MCCFSRPVESVTNTNLFARSARDGRQSLVYSMSVSSKEDLAMILPLPVPQGTAEDAVRFIDLKGYPGFFKDLKTGFPEPVGHGERDDKPRSPALKSEPLRVVSVGDFEASFVPSVKDFARLDARFRLPDAAWDDLPGYRSHGFAVFKLRSGAKTVHPMAFEFPRLDPKRLFFPTVHIHDGKVHPKAAFDHSLYCQSLEGEALGLMTWQESGSPASRFVKTDLAQGLVDGARHVYLKTIRGEQKNEDTLV